MNFDASLNAGHEHELTCNFLITISLHAQVYRAYRNNKRFAIERETQEISINTHVLKVRSGQRTPINSSLHAFFTFSTITKKITTHKMFWQNAWLDVVLLLSYALIAGPGCGFVQGVPASAPNSSLPAPTGIPKLPPIACPRIHCPPIRWPPIRCPIIHCPPNPHTTGGLNPTALPTILPLPTTLPNPILPPGGIHPPSSAMTLAVVPSLNTSCGGGSATDNNNVCFQKAYDLPAGENLVVASVDAVNNLMLGIAKILEDIAGKPFTSIGPIILADLRTLTAIVAMAVAHITLSSAQGLFKSENLVYVLRGFVTASQIFTSALLGQKGFFAQFKFLDPIRNTLLSLKSFFDRVALRLIGLIPIRSLSSGKAMKMDLDEAMNNLLEAYAK
ncbi:hypothetical protein O181_042864 [Austropuccinia psidii MF-1]|uniref:Uncharacterized protein n=1 Tax=Austropuccinia psidii MF-1 TaxID=1389203 RepID=A0A9Q3DGX0_9BASI|nr:hypothetical protein [Austropuccinia psidii MF-1]